MNNMFMDRIDEYLRDTVFIHDALNLLNILISYFDKNNIVHYIAQGTLLGYKKYKSVMPWEFDVDINVIERDIFSTNSFNDLISSNKLIYEWRHENTILKIKYEGKEEPHADVCIVEKKETIYCSGKYCNEIPPDRWFIDRIPHDYLMPLRKVKMNGITVNVPNKTDEILNKIYPNYQTQIVVGPIYNNNNELILKKLIISNNLTAFHYLTGVVIGISKYCLVK